MIFYLEIVGYLVKLVNSTPDISDLTEKLIMLVNSSLDGGGKGEDPTDSNQVKVPPVWQAEEHEVNTRDVCGQEGEGDASDVEGETLF